MKKKNEKYMPKSKVKSKVRSKKKVADKNKTYPVLEFVGKVESTDVDNGKRKPSDESASTCAKKTALKFAESAGLKTKKRVNYFPKKSSSKKRK